MNKNTPKPATRSNMSTANTRKRPAEQDVPSPNPKRAAPSKGPDVVAIDDEDDADFQIETKLHDRFKVFPDVLRETIETAYKSTLRSQMTALRTNTVLKNIYTFSIVSEFRVRQSNNGPNTTICKSNISSLSLANTALLNHFLRARNKDKLTKGSFVRLKTVQGIANPDFINLHAVRHGEVGWGFDAYGCLSLFSVSVENNRLKEYAVYVQRTELKVEKEDGV